MREPILLDLTKKELEVLSLINEGLSNKEIALRINCGLKTTENHIGRIYYKLEVNNRVQAALFYERNKWSICRVITPDGIEFSIWFKGKVIRIRKIGWIPIELECNESNNEIFINREE